MKARFVNEALKFQRGIDPKRAMGIGIGPEEATKLLMEAIEKNDIEGVKFYINFDLIEETVNYGLGKAASKGHFDIVKLLIERDISIIANSMCTLNWTSWTNHYEVMDYLLNQEEFKFLQKDLKQEKLGEFMSNVTSSNNSTSNNKLQMVKVFLKHGGDPMGVTQYGNKTSRYNEPLRNACENNLSEIVELLLEEGAKPDEMYYNQERTMLCEAALKGFTKIVELLVKFGANVNAVNGMPLFLASIHGHEDIVKFLLDNGANPKLRNYAAIRITKFPAIKDILRNYKK